MANSGFTIEHDGRYLRTAVPIPGSTPERVLACFTDPSQLESWWGGELDAELVQGGRYVVRFAELGRAMVGRVLKYDPPSSLEFGWSWDATGEDPARRVALFIRHDETTTLTTVHGPYGDDESERTAREEHRAGWDYFLPRLDLVLES